MKNILGHIEFFLKHSQKVNSIIVVGNKNFFAVAIIYYVLKLIREETSLPSVQLVVIIFLKYIYLISVDVIIKGW